MLQSTWTVAAQYCQHEENPKVEHIGHHTHEHNSQNADNGNDNGKKSSDSSKSEIDTDCAFCHLGSIKSMITDLPEINAEIEPIELSHIYHSYPEIIPVKPERPNWILAA